MGCGASSIVRNREYKSRGKKNNINNNKKERRKYDVSGDPDADNNNNKNNNSNNCRQVAHSVRERVRTLLINNDSISVSLSSSSSSSSLIANVIVVLRVMSALRIHDGKIITPLVTEVANEIKAKRAQTTIDNKITSDCVSVVWLVAHMEYHYVPALGPILNTIERALIAHTHNNNNNNSSNDSPILTLRAFSSFLIAIGKISSLLLKGSSATTYEPSGSALRAYCTLLPTLSPAPILSSNLRAVFNSLYVLVVTFGAYQERALLTILNGVRDCILNVEVNSDDIVRVLPSAYSAMGLSILSRLQMIDGGSLEMTGVCSELKTMLWADAFWKENVAEHSVRDFCTAMTSFANLATAEDRQWVCDSLYIPKNNNNNRTIVGSHDVVVRQILSYLHHSHPFCSAVRLKPSELIMLLDAACVLFGKPTSASDDPVVCRAFAHLGSSTVLKTHLSHDIPSYRLPFLFRAVCCAPSEMTTPKQREILLGRLVSETFANPVPGHHLVFDIFLIAYGLNERENTQRCLYDLFPQQPELLVRLLELITDAILLSMPHNNNNNKAASYLSSVCSIPRIVTDRLLTVCNFALDGSTSPPTSVSACHSNNNNNNTTIPAQVTAR
eukprot:PhM_4_TR10472/c2_g1_i1/m.2079